MFFMVSLEILSQRPLTQFPYENELNYLNDFYEQTW